ncbi:hypothetical protein AGABI2DRAFT_192724 [Agaricus bisporus var. bisporus H97]|uniref:hypothetical protein n=1 Tax=Agaricus bisporus var. bisporus (strain H97 / ATCC MYA-4626 / FGSC 10389) TaxID=936046 RepID=UPI00029F764B|nr:hypothetical protein AGABI2DRAFT_192724 [Agaricus bisporus var. bisporus H97]EKV47541.1 hypothetical protein AGABI2DRAFT_192724 [Agaricus bisporus var. bisporus H97]
MYDSDTDGLAFDPDQDLEQKRSLRQSYRNLANKIEEYQGNPASLGVENLQQQLEKADELFQKVKGPSEATLDSHFLLMASNVGAQKARAMKSGTGSFDMDEFITKVRNFMNGGLKPENIPEEDDEIDPDYNTESSKLDWDRIGRLALAKSRRAPALSFMLGPLSIEQKVRNVTKRARQEKDNGPVAKPENVNQGDIQEVTNETTKNVSLLMSLLEQSGEVNLFRFVINPNDFAQSVENIFYLSFLIRDGKVALEFRDSEPVIFPCDPPSYEDYAQGLKKQQLVVEFDQEIWREAIEVFKITSSVIPQRPKETSGRGDKKW